ncbi:MAG: hypothetical protein VBE63_08205 [Lamprobacter sp.]|uniref:hypothetical protein n=1 Tax=Lamprobacter sp. TaxID=3100796 RepID=UPI002B262A99|nr:hypothetical protein [Lamprobacter sp.]MEA3639911.1 hypothetical protein [Lamprobacter sp.]
MTQVLEPANVAHDVDAAHARLRSHQANLDYVNSRLDGNERRIDRLERRIDDQSQVLADTKAMTTSIREELCSQHKMLERAAERQADIIESLQEHIQQEIMQEKTRTEQVERLHRTILRATTLFGVLALGLAAIAEQRGLFAQVIALMGGG